MLTEAGLDAGSVENASGPGTPDIQYVGGWLELKWLAAWPKKADTPVVIEHFTPQQRVWAIRRAQVDPQGIWLLLEVEKTREWLLFRGQDVREIGKTLPQSELRLLAICVTKDPHDLLPYLTHKEGR
jgi:hypothetical protein